LIGTQLAHVKGCPVTGYSLNDSRPHINAGVDDIFWIYLFS